MHLFHSSLLLFNHNTIIEQAVILIIEFLKWKCMSIMNWGKTKRLIWSKFKTTKHPRTTWTQHIMEQVRYFKKKKKEALFIFSCTHIQTHSIKEIGTDYQNKYPGSLALCKKENPHSERNLIKNYWIISTPRGPHYYLYTICWWRCVVKPLDVFSTTETIDLLFK